MRKKIAFILIMALVVINIKEAVLANMLPVVALQVVVTETICSGEQKVEIEEVNEEPFVEIEEAYIEEESSNSWVQEFEVTAYCACKKCCGANAMGITSSGVPPTPRHTIAAGRDIPFGTLIEIDGVIFQVEDRGGAIKNNKIDMFMSSHQEALQYGRRRVYGEIIRWGY